MEPFAGTTEAREQLRLFARAISERFPGWFSAGEALWVARAPGRLDVMGGIADYSGSLVLELPLDRATFVAAQTRSDGLMRVWSANAGAEGLQAQYRLHLRELGVGKRPLTYKAFRERVGKNARTRWLRYVLGAGLALLREKVGERDVPGVTLAVWSTVPPGAGVASSAALEVAALAALARVWGVRLEPRELASLAQKVENLAVGAPCGIMDQMTAVFARRNHLLALLCQPAEIRGHVPVPDDVLLCGLNTGVKHSVGGDRYRDVRVATFMGRKIIFAEAACRGVNFGEYLCNISPEVYVQHYRSLLPKRMSGAEFLARYGSHDDPVTEVDPERVYRVRSRTEHPIYENARVHRFREWLQAADRADDDRALWGAGRLMFASHWSYSTRCGLGAQEADFIVKEVRRLGPEAGLYGAKITGGGSGGTVAILAKRGAEAVIRQIAGRYAERFGLEPELLWGSSDGVLVGRAVPAAGAGWKADP